MADRDEEGDVAGFLADWELRESDEWVIVTDTNTRGLPGLHRASCSYFKADHNWPVVQPQLAELAFAAEVERNRTGQPRKVYFDPRCMIRRRTS